jgi:UPF0755 protein
MDMRKAVKLIFGLMAFFVGVALFAAIAAVASFSYFNSPPPFSHDAVEGRDGIAVEGGDGIDIVIRFDVRRGESAQSVGRRLAESGVIRNQLFWQLICRFSNEHIKTGTYRIEVPVSQIAIHQLLVAGRQILQRVTIPEGFTLKKTARLLDESGICTEEDFLAAASNPEIVARYRIP